MEVGVSRELYSDKICIEMIPYALPFNPNSFSIMQIFPGFLASAEVTKQYIELSFAHIGIDQ